MNWQGCDRIWHASSLIMLSLRVCLEGQSGPQIIRYCDPEERGTSAEWQIAIFAPLFTSYNLSSCLNIYCSTLPRRIDTPYLFINVLKLKWKKLAITIWRCMYRASYCNVYIDQRDAKLFWIVFIFSLNCSTCFGLSLVHHQEQHLISCTVQLVHAGTSGCCQTYRHVPIAL